ncbi:MAG: DUF2130 domain-containing protein [Patescibacteria group bacterium]|nr:DUF2130 domain-containing protein [Patescibacteria group bacterium]
MSSPTNQVTVTCPKCQHKFSIGEALTHQMEEQVSASLEQKHKSEIEEATRLAEEKAEKNAKEQFGIQMVRMQKENDEEKERNKKLTSQMSELLDDFKALRRKDEEREIEMKKKAMEDEERIRSEVRKQAEEENQLKNLEKDKKLNDALKKLDELQNQMQQGSQQTQGEVLELELEKALKQEFLMDILEEVKKGERGADIVHRVVDKLGRNSGTILWESKNAQWKNDWITKLKEDQRAKKADLAVLVTIHKPEGLETFTYREGVWLTTWQFVIPLALALRFNLISLNHEKSLSEGKNEKKEILYQYLTGTEFKQRVEAIVEAFSGLQDELEREKRWFSVKWGRQEKEIRKVLDHTHGMYGDLQGIIGRSLPQLAGFEIEEEREISVLEEVVEE